MTSMKLPKGTFIPGRNAMTCCAEDIRFFGFLCKYDRARSLKKGEWVMVAARIQWEESTVYRGGGRGPLRPAGGAGRAARTIPWSISDDPFPGAPAGRRENF